MSTSIDQLPLPQILANLSNLDSDFATAIITQHFKGLQEALLLKYVQGEITAEEISVEWRSVPYSGILPLDAKIPSLSLLDRLTLLAITLKQLGITTDHLGFLYETPAPDIHTLVGTLTLLVSDLVNKDHLKIKRKDTQLALIEYLLPEIPVELPEIPVDVIDEPEDAAIIGNWTSEELTKDIKPTMNDIFF